MKCPRCYGFMIQDQAYEVHGPFLHIDMWRCLNCGESFDSAILRARQQKEETKNKQKICRGVSV